MLKLIRGAINIPGDFSGCVATIGNFDGVHLGHQQLIKQLLEKAKQFNLPSLVITFEPQPNEFFTHGNVPPRLMRLREKLVALENLGVDYVLCLPFNQAMAHLSAHDFAQNIFIEKLKAHYILVGDDFRFGHRREGDIELLKKIVEQQSTFTAENMTTHRLENNRVSSTLVRVALEQGNLPEAERLLGRGYSIAGRVRHGHKRGRMIGFPTANVFLHRKAVPLSGVFAVKTYGLQDGPVYGVANVGTRPTIGGTRTLLEVHLFNFNQDIYGRHISVEFVHKLRDEEKYDSFELLRQQILKDAENAKQFFAENS